MACHGQFFPSIGPYLDAYLFNLVSALFKLVQGQQDFQGELLPFRGGRYQKEECEAWYLEENVGFEPLILQELVCIGIAEHTVKYIGVAACCALANQLRSLLAIL